tara:strand:- start:1447 stop:3123 length:1677 start_codon:yes stop_codon:yes gene_type:complete
MSLNILTFVLFYLIIINSTIGIGYLIGHFTKIKKKEYNLGYYGLTGIFVLIIFSYTTHYFLPHNYFHNIAILIIGFLSFFYFTNKNENHNELVKINILFLILFISFLIYKTHDDFPYYHFPYTHYLTQSELFIGIGNFNHGFRTPSSIFYLNSLYYLPLLDHHFFQLGAVKIMGFTVFIFLKIVENKLQLRKNDQYFFLSLFSLIFILIFFYRIAEHGTDRSAQILIFLFIFELLFLFNNKEFLRSNIIKLFILLGIIISLKAFYILYFLFVIPVFYFFIKEKKVDYLILIFTNSFFFLFILMFINILLVNFFNSGCFIYPVSFTCLSNFSWSIPISEVAIMNDWYEQWAKAGANPNFRVDNPEQYIQKLNWFNNWFNEYFFTKVSDFLFGIIFIVIIFLILFNSSKKIKVNIKGNNLIYSVLLLLFIEWFYNHPSLRYGGYTLICLLFFLPVSFYLSQSSDIKKITLKSVILVCIAMTVFLSRNINRINDENKKYQYNPLINIKYHLDQKHFRISDKFDYLISEKLNCKISNEICKKPSGELDVKEKFGYKIFYKIK